MISISMNRRGSEWIDYPCDYPIIIYGPVRLGLLMLHRAHRYPSDPIWLVETIGL